MEQERKLIDIDNEIINLAEEVNNNTGHRENLVSRIMSAASQVEINPSIDTPREIEAKLAILKSAEEIISGKEGARNRTVSAALRRASIDIEKEKSSQVVDLLRTLRPDPNGNPIDPFNSDEADRTLEESLTSEEKQYGEEEIELERTDKEDKEEKTE